MKKEHQKKAFEARQEAKAKKLFEVLGWEISVDDRNYYTKKDKITYYHMSLLNALLDIADIEQRNALKMEDNLNLDKAVEILKSVNERLIAELEARLPKK